MDDLSFRGAKQKHTEADAIPWYPAVVAELQRLTGHWKQEPTLLGILSREVSGRRWDNDDFWALPDIANRSTYYKWMLHDQTFQEVSANCRAAIAAYRRQEALTAIDEAILLLQEAAPQAARRLIRVLSDPSKDSDAIRAANSLLDRASASTASKTADQTVHMPEVADALNFIYGISTMDDDESE